VGKPQWLSFAKNTAFIKAFFSARSGSFWRRVEIFSAPEKNQPKKIPLKIFSEKLVS
jgi:hypothetical protein